MEENRKYKISELATSNSSQYSKNEKWSIVRYLDTGSITNNIIEEMQTIRMGVDEFPSRARRKVKRGDIIYSTVRPNQKHFGYIENPAENMLVSTGFTVLSVNEDVADSKYLYYWLSQQSIIDYLHAVGEQAVSAYPSIKAKDIEDLEIILPPLFEQRHISSILTCIDSKIELNRRINDNLEQQVQLMFDKTFVNYPATNFCRLSDIANINPKRIISKNTKARYIEMSNLPTKGSFPCKWEYKDYNGGMKFTNGDTIMARITPCLENGKVAYINFLDKGEISFGSTEYIVISSKGTYRPEWFYFLTRNKLFIDYSIKHMNGSSGRQRVSGESIGDFQIPLFSMDSLQPLFTMSEIALKTITRNSLENIELSAIRDFVLPKLMSGELKINEINN